MSMGETTWISDVRSEWFDRTIERLLIALLIFAPLAFGTVEAWSEQIVIALASAMLMCLLLKVVVTRRREITWTWAYVPIALFTLIVVLQLIPLPQGIVRLVSPNTVARRSELLGDLPNASSILSRMTISFYPHGTRHDLRLVLAVVAVFIVVFNTFRRPEQILRLMIVIASIGAGVAVLAFAQNIFGNDKIYWCVPSPHQSAHSGPFVNHSHYAQFINLSTGAAFGALFVKVRELFRGRSVAPEAIVDCLGSPEARPVWFLIAMIAVSMGSVFVSLSRGGVISLLIAAAFVTLILSSRRTLTGSGWVMAVLALAAFICVLYVGFDAVYDRLSTLGDFSEAEGGRWEIVSNILVAWTRFPVLGTGLGTHAVVYPEFDRSVVPALASHAENEYAQAIEETGAVGILVLVSFAVLIWVHYARAVRKDRIPICTAAYGLGFGVMAIMIHSLSDFGQHLPANAMLTAIFCALLIRLARFGHDDMDGMEEAVPVGTRSLRYWVAGCAVVGVLCVGTVWGANNARLAESHWRAVLAAEENLMQRGWQGSDQEYIDLLDHAQKAAEYQPDNVERVHWLNVYRWHAVRRNTDPNTGGFLWSETNLEFVERIVEELNRARTVCPTFGATWCVLGQLERSVLGQDEAGAEHIREGVKLAPADATARFVAGTLAIEEGQIETAGDHLATAVQLDHRLFGDIASLLITEFDQPDLALQIAGEDIRLLYAVVKTLEDVGAETASVEAVRSKVLILLEQKSQEPTAPAWVSASLAGMYRAAGEVTEAIKYYRHALTKDYGQVEWRCRLARLLADTQAVKEAIEQLEIVLRLRPEHGQAKRMLAEISASVPIAAR